jgi:hypothetical protein
LKSIFQKIIQTSILPGAFFFCSLNVIGGISDSAAFNDTISKSRIDSLKALKHATPRHDTVRVMQSMQTDSLYTPSVNELKRMTVNHSPHKATIYSAVLPGLGQAYNRKYWKIPIIYSAGLALYYGFGWLGFQDWGWKHYNDYYQIFKEDYQNEYYNPEGDQSLEDYYKKNMSYARKKRDQITIFMGILYFANIVDAMADAYFYEFDISDDLSMKVLPSISSPNPYVAYNDYALGVKLRFNF